MSLTHYYTQNWLITSPKELEEYLKWAFTDDGSVNPNISAHKVLIVESVLGVTTKNPASKGLRLLIYLLGMHRHLKVDFYLLTNSKPELLDPRLRRHIDNFKKWK